MRIGIIGCGRIAKAHIQALSLIKSVDSIGLFDTLDTQINLVSIESRIPVYVYKSIAELALNCDGAIICTPNNLHVATIEAVLSASKIPIVCEKPLSHDLESSKHLLKILDNSSIISFNYRYNKLIQSIQSAVTQYKLGKLVKFEAKFNKNSAITRKNLTWRDSGASGKSSGALGDLSCHLLDLFCFMSSNSIDINSVKVVKGLRVKEKNNAPVEVDDNGYVFGRSKSGAYFSIKSSKSEPLADIGLFLNFTYENADLTYSTLQENLISLYPFNKLGAINISFDDSKLIPDPKGELPFWSDSFYYMLLDWCSCIQNKKPSAHLPTIDCGVHIQEIIEKF